eukprot:gene35474-43739_t
MSAPPVFHARINRWVFLGLEKGLSRLTAMLENHSSSLSIRSSCNASVNWILPKSRLGKSKKGMKS